LGKLAIYNQFATDVIGGLRTMEDGNELPPAVRTASLETLRAMLPHLLSSSVAVSAPPQLLVSLCALLKSDGAPTQSEERTALEYLWKQVYPVTQDSEASTPLDAIMAWRSVYQTLSRDKVKKASVKKKVTNKVKKTPAKKISKRKRSGEKDTEEKMEEGERAEKEGSKTRKTEGRAKPTVVTGKAEKGVTSNRKRKRTEQGMAETAETAKTEIEGKAEKSLKKKKGKNAEPEAPDVIYCCSSVSQEAPMIACDACEQWCAQPPHPLYLLAQPPQHLCIVSGGT
jgi:hypothetical protein